ncbi:MAG: protein kinase [Deltaproteobacteria bacterium]|nr:protein kinase [Deltaproteobacteria bacterium]
MSDLTGTVLEGKYRLVRLLGVGGMGSVYEAEHTLISRRVAVKLLLPQLADIPEMAERFLREARSASEIDHENIIGIHDVGRSDDGHLFIVMELLEGKSLRQLLGQQRRLDLDRATRITLEVLAGLEAAHEQGTVHRDLKPDNIFLVEGDDGGERVKILDFGISKVKDGDAEGGLTQTGAVLGTPHYMAPEQANGDPDVDQRIDIWATGVILYEMLSGGRPYEGNSYNRVIAQILVEPPPRLLDVAPAVPASLAQVVDRALAKERDERYADAPSMMADLSRVTDELLELMSSETVITPSSTEDRGASTGTAAEGGPGRGTSVQDGPEQAEDLGSAATEALASPFLEGGAATPSRFLRMFWVVLCLPFPLLLLFVALAIPTALVGVVGLREDAPPAFGYGLALALAGGTALASWQIYRFWARGFWNRWLQGLGFLVFPAAGLLLVFRAHTALTSNMDSALASFRAYGPITMAQAKSVLTSLSGVLANHLNAVAVVTTVVAYLALLVLLGQVFRPPGRGEPRFAKHHWLVLPAGLGVVVATYVFFHYVTTYPLPLWVLIAYVPWVLTTIPILRLRREPSGRGSSWRLLLSGVVAQVAVMGVASAGGFIDMFERLQRFPSGRRSTFWEEATVVVNQALWAIGLVTILLAVLLVASCWRAFGWGAAGLAERAKAFGVAVIMVGATGLSTVILVVDNDAVRVAMALPTWKPALVEMVPAALAPKGAATYYLDRNPSTLRQGREALLRRMTVATGTEDFDRAALLGALAGHERCPELLEATLGPADHVADAPEPPPARCVTAIEARLYCEGRGKRLPTPAEWDGALKDVAPTEPEVAARTGPLWRGPFGEWTMEQVHGTPTFHIRGGQAAPQDPGQLHPNELSEHVGFRCAFRFDD